MAHHPKTGSDEDASVAALERKSLGGIGSLVKRQVGIRLLSFMANIALARLLIPEAFGIYAIVEFIIQFFSTFGDAGIGAALIQKKGQLSDRELSSTFWLQQILVWCVVVFVFAAAPLAYYLYPSLPSYGVWLIRIMAVSFALSSLKTMPAILMERRLDFGKIAVIDVVETIAFYAVAVLMALAGFGVWSFIIAALLRAFSGTGLIFLLYPWRPSRVFDFSAIRDLVRFGVPYQGNRIISFIKDAVTPAFIGAYAGAAAVGYVTWAKSLALAPMMLSESFGRVAFPAFSQIQHDRPLLGRAVERSIRNITLVMFPITALMIALGPEIIQVVFTSKWLPALPAYYFYCTSPLLVGLVLPMYSAILSLGKSGIILRMMITLAILEWGTGVPLVLIFGFNGIAYNQPVIAALFIWIYWRVLRSESVDLFVFRNIRTSLFSAAAAGMAAKIIMIGIPLSFLALTAAALSGTTIYLVCVWLLEKSALNEFRENIVKIFRGGSFE